MEKCLCFLLLIMVLLVSSTQSQSIHNLSFTDINGANIQMSSFSGKKVVFVIAPVNQSDSLLISEIRQFRDIYRDSIVLIGVMSSEDGFSAANSSAVKALYEQRGIPIILTAGMYTKKSAGASQSAIMQWLTKRTSNARFNIDAMGVMHKFFVNAEGKLYGVISPRVSLLDASVGWSMYRDN